MTITTSITESNIFKALGNFITSILPAGTPVVQGQQNRVAEPAGKDFVVMWPLLTERISQNVDSLSDIAFVGSINGNNLTVTQILAGVIGNGNVLSANGILPNTIITGGSGLSFTVNNAQILASTTIQAGSVNYLSPRKVTMQLDIHGPNSADYGQIISTLFNDQFGVDNFAGSGFDLSPLTCTEPRQMPFIAGEQQYEERWTIEVVIQANPIVEVAQQFAGNVTLTIKDANTYPV